jgi:hypothetical protein
MPNTNVRIIQSPTTTTTSGTNSCTRRVGTCDNPLPEQKKIANCIANYNTCLSGSDACGEHFKLCTSRKLFNRQKAVCLDHLWECPADAINSIFGSSITITESRTNCDGESVVTSRTASSSLCDLTGEGENSIMLKIKEGMSWAAANSVTTCYDTADACIKKACENSPQRCLLDQAEYTTSISKQAEMQTLIYSIASSSTNTRIDSSIFKNYISKMQQTDDESRAYVRGECQAEIGGNEYCYMVATGDKAKDADLIDNINVRTTYANIMESGIGARLATNQAKIREWLAKKVLDSVNSCKEAAGDCVKSTCSGASLAACWGAATKGSQSGAPQIEQSIYKDKINETCGAIVKANQSCKDLFDDSANIWAQVWGTTTGNTDFTAGSLGLSGELNAELSRMFGEGNVKHLRQSCETSAEDCIRSKCGQDFSNCFINGDKNTPNSLAQGAFGSDGIHSGAMAGGFSKEMARGLCLLSVKKIQNCRDYFDVQYAKLAESNSADSWGTGYSLYNAWSGRQNLSLDQPLTCTATENYTQYITETVDESGNVIKTIESTPTLAKDIVTKCAGQEQNIFNALIAGVADEAQRAAELRQNKKKNDCIAKNKNNGRTFSWAEIPDNDNLAMFLTNRQTATAELWGAFCQAEITISFNTKQTLPIECKNHNDEMYHIWVESPMEFTCGNGIPKACFEKIVTTAQGTELGDEECVIEVDEAGNKTETCAKKEMSKGMIGLYSTLAGVGGGALGVIGGAFAGKGLDNLFNGNKNKEIKADNAVIEKCQQTISAATARLNKVTTGLKIRIISNSVKGESDYVAYQDVVADNTEAAAAAAAAAKSNTEIIDECGTIGDKKTQTKAMAATAGALGAVGASLAAWGTAQGLNERNRSNKAFNDNLKKLKKEAAGEAAIKLMEKTSTCHFNGKQYKFGETIEVK